MMKRLVAIFMSVVISSGFLTFSGNAAERGNIALGKSYEITTGAANENSYQNSEVGEKTQLTDGKYGQTTMYYAGPWAHFVRGVSRTITVDLETVMSVDSVSLRFIQHKVHGIYSPREVIFSISENGEDYMTVKSMLTPVANTADGHLSAKYSFTSDSPYKARYVRIYFDVQVNSFTDEIEIYGGEITGREAEFVPDETPDLSEYLDNGEALGGDRDIICFHYGYYPDDPKLANNVKSDFMPYIGYQDASKKIVDTMFDSVMFLIIQGLSPSGGGLNCDKGPTIKSDWDYLIENTFGENINLDALDQATADLKQTLELPSEHKTSVYLAVPHAKESDIVFGDYTGDGVDDKIQSLDDCVALYAWYVKTVSERFASMEYENIELKGFFWSNESLGQNHYEHEYEYAKRCVAEVKKLGLLSVFIPFYQATGVERIEDIGFDSTIMQPNLNFDETLQKNPELMMEDFVKNAKRFHTGIQMEVHHSLLNSAENFKKFSAFFEQYLKTAANSELMKDSVHAYYNGAGPGIFYKLANSTKAEERWFYDALYKFIKNTLVLDDNLVLEMEKTELTGTPGTFVRNGMKYSDNINMNEKIYIKKHPQNGTLALNFANKIALLRTDRNFVGEDYYEIAYLDKDDVEHIIRVDVSIVDGEESPNDTVESNDSSGGDNSEADGINTGLIIGLGAAFIGVSGAAAFGIIKKRKSA